MTNQKNNTTPEAPQESPRGQESNHKAFAKAFVAKHYYEVISSEPFIEPMDAAERIDVFNDLFSAGDISACSLVLGDCVMSLPPHKRQSVIDLIIWAVLKADTMDWGT